MRPLTDCEDRLVERHELAVGIEKVRGRNCCKAVVVALNEVQARRRKETL